MDDQPKETSFGERVLEGILVTVFSALIGTAVEACYEKWEEYKKRKKRGVRRR